MTTRRGWVSSPNERGTMDIIWSCVSTLFICLWSMLHLNVPSKKDSFWTIVWRKARWLLLGILAPEVPMLFACGQWASAKRSVNDMRKLGFSDAEWSLEHAWYADSGGFELQPLEGEPLPITARQVWYLKFLAYFQTAWLVTQTVGRAIQHLAITPLELASIALALTSLTTLGFWMHKPLDVGTATTLHTDRSIRDILEHAGEIFLADFTNTPLDFIEPRIYVSRKCGSALLNWILHRGLQTRPIERIPDDRDPQLYNIYQRITLGIATASFASIHLAGWNFGFDTTWEMWLWRSNCLIMWGLLATFGTTEVIICCRDNFQSMGMDTLGGYKLRWPACLWFVIPGGLYVMARACLIFEVLFSMRSLPQEAFVEVQWSAMLPHI